MRTVMRAAVAAGAAWVFGFLYFTPRGDEVLNRAFDRIFPEWTRRRN